MAKPQPLPRRGPAGQGTSKKQPDPQWFSPTRRSSVPPGPSEEKEEGHRVVPVLRDGERSCPGDRVVPVPPGRAVVVLCSTLSTQPGFVSCGRHQPGLRQRVALAGGTLGVISPNRLSAAGMEQGSITGQQAVGWGHNAPQTGTGTGTGRGCPVSPAAGEQDPCGMHRELSPSRAST